MKSGNSEPRFTLLVDVKLRRPACALLQACAKTDRSALRFFDAEHWLTFPTDHMRLVSGTASEWRLLADALAARREER